MPKRNLLPIVIVATASVATFVSLAADQLGLDRAAGWGTARRLLLAFGILLYVLAALRLTSQQGTTIRGLLARLADRLRLDCAERSGLGQVRSPAVVPGLAVFIATAAFILWYGSAGKFPNFPYVSNDYSDLGEAFLHGRLSLLETPNEQLLSLSDPYLFENRRSIPYRWDASLYDRKYYLYWGPVPALVAAALQLMLGAPPSGVLLVVLAYLGMMAAGLAFLSRVWRRLHGTRAPLAVGMFYAVTFLNLPLLFQLGQSRVYEASILYAQFLLFTGLLLWDHYRTSRHPLWLAGAGLAWTLAAGSRYSIVVAVAVLVTIALVAMTRDPAVDHRRSVAALLAPIMMGLIVAALYNYLRFDSPFQTGQSLQLTAHPVGGPKYSLSYLPSSLYAYLLYPLTLAGRFPFVRTALFDPARLPDWGGLPPGRIFDHVLFGTLPAVPILGLVVLSVVPVIHATIAARRRHSPDSSAKDWLITWGMLAAPAAALFLFIGCYYYEAERYVGDFLPLALLATALGVARLDEILVERRSTRAALWIVTGLLAAVTILVGVFGAFSVPPKILSTENEPLYRALAGYWNDRADGLLILFDRLRELLRLP